MSIRAIFIHGRFTERVGTRTCSLKGCFRACTNYSKYNEKDSRKGAMYCMYAAYKYTVVSMNSVVQYSTSRNVCVCYVHTPEYVCSIHPGCTCTCTCTVCMHIIQATDETRGEK
jgi:hypothetical protein